MDDVTKIAYMGEGVKNPENFCVRTLWMAPYFTPGNPSAFQVIPVLYIVRLRLGKILLDLLDHPLCSIVEVNHGIDVDTLAR